MNFFEERVAILFILFASTAIAFVSQNFQVFEVGRFATQEQRNVFSSSSIGCVFIVLPFLLDVVIDNILRKPISSYELNSHNLTPEERLYILVGSVIPAVYYLIIGSDQIENFKSFSRAFRLLQATFYSSAVCLMLRRNVHHQIDTGQDALSFKLIGSNLNRKILASRLIIATFVLFAVSRLIFIFSFNVDNILNAVILQGWSVAVACIACFLFLALLCISFFNYFSTKSWRLHPSAFSLQSGYFIIALAYILFEFVELSIFVSMLITRDSTSILQELIFANISSIVFCLVVFVLSVRIIKYDVIREKAHLDSHRSFVRFISHELRTPLTTVCLGLDLLQADTCADIAMEGKRNEDRNKSIVSLMQSDSDKSSKHATPVGQPAVALNPSRLDRIVLDKLNFGSDKSSSNQTSATFSSAAMEAKGKVIATINVIRKSCDDVVGILDSLLKYDNEAGPMDAVLDCYPVTEICRLIATMVKPFFIQAKHADVSLEFINTVADGGEFCGYLDKNMIAQVVRNLVSNAIRFTPSEGAVFISIVFEDESAQSRFCGHRRKLLSVNIVDTGIGLSPEMLKEILPTEINVVTSSDRKFDQLRPHASMHKLDSNNSSIVSSNKLMPDKRARHGTGTGSGLGLKIAARVLRDHGGTISLHSAGQNLGCFASFSLPVYAVTVRQRKNFEVYSDRKDRISNASSHSSRVSSQPSNLDGDDSTDSILINRMVVPTPIPLSTASREHVAASCNEPVVVQATSSGEIPGIASELLERQAEQAIALGNAPRGVSFDMIRRPNLALKHSSGKKSGSRNEYALSEAISERLRLFSSRNEAIHPMEVFAQSPNSEDDATKWTRKVLVVDDSKLARSMICNMLQKLDYICDEAINGVEAVDMVAKSAFVAGTALHQNSHLQQHLHVPVGPSVNFSKDAEDIAEMCMKVHYYSTQPCLSYLESGITLMSDKEPTGKDPAGHGDVSVVNPPDSQLASVGETSHGLVPPPAGFSSTHTEHRSFGYCMILMDNLMPRKDGPTAVREIRQLGYLGPIFGVTGNTLPSDVSSFMQCGLTDLLPKPLRFQNFKSTLQHHHID